ncbi:DUF1127 domain-containing protein [Labrys neptuniae]|uniref:DUF1127 domain-containing protein n=1 Tax=Labrys TaxID=204476 RepID=UPI0028925F0E|nr:DUF1127 domain-containing protein [Labrys neptuniae]MDT3378236.1 DUF1127 domain-containing protein [Labrys neptuniae]
MPVSFSTVVRPEFVKKRATRYRALGALRDAIVRFLARRAALADLRDHDDFALRDIGLARGDIEAAVYGRPIPPGGTKAS